MSSRSAARVERAEGLLARDGFALGATHPLELTLGEAIRRLRTVFFRSTPPVDGAEALPSDREAYTRFFGAMLDQGILSPPSQFEAWSMSMAHGPAEIEATVDAAQKAFAA
jgi:glutamate-1-semialdehyde 2,1-aminomutase